MNAVEPNPFVVIRARLYADVYAAWSKAWADNCHLMGDGGADRHARRALEEFDKAIDWLPKPMMRADGGEDIPL